MSNITIISGGQTGVDRAALDFALENKITCGGKCPKGRIAEDGKLSVKYPLTETYSTDYAVRTRSNIIESDGTLILMTGKDMDKGTKFTVALAKEREKHLNIIDMNDDVELSSIMLKQWLKENKIKTLNIAGNRESRQAGIYKLALNYLQQMRGIFV